jgi:hypothetical protein
MRAYWKYEMVNGEGGNVTSLPIDIVVAEKTTKTFLSQGVGFEFMTVAVHSALKRAAKRDGGEFPDYDAWMEDLAVLEDRDPTEVKDEDMPPFGDSETSPSLPPSVSASWEQSSG